jgi:hypothetical protein
MDCPIISCGAAFDSVRTADGRSGALAALGRNAFHGGVSPRRLAAQNRLSRWSVNRVRNTAVRWTSVHPASQLEDRGEVSLEVQDPAELCIVGREAAFRFQDLETFPQHPERSGTRTRIAHEREGSASRIIHEVDLQRLLLIVEFHMPVAGACSRWGPLSR